jgi:hypothetical protein
MAPTTKPRPKLTVPAGDIGVLLAVRGLSAPGHLLLNLASGCVFASAAVWMRRA